MKEKKYLISTEKFHKSQALHSSDFRLSRSISLKPRCMRGEKKRKLICPKPLCLLLNKYKGSEVSFYVPLPFCLRLTLLCLVPNLGRVGGGRVETRETFI